MNEREDGRERCRRCVDQADGVACPLAPETHRRERKPMANGLEVPGPLDGVAVFVATVALVVTRSPVVAWRVQREGAYVFPPASDVCRAFERSAEALRAAGWGR